MSAQNEPQFTPYSSLYGLLQRAIPERNEQTDRSVRNAGAEELRKFADSADSALLECVTAIRSIGVLIEHCDTSEISKNDWTEIAQALVMLAESQLALNDLRVAAENSESED